MGSVDLKVLELLSGFLPFLASIRNYFMGPFEVDVKHILYDQVFLPRADGSFSALSVSRLTGGILNRSSTKVSIRRLEAQMLNAANSDPRVALKPFEGPKLLEPGEVYEFDLDVSHVSCPVQSLIIVFASNKEKTYPVRETMNIEPRDLTQPFR